jgi:hypothetical protein
VPNSYVVYAGVTRKRINTMLMLVMKMQKEVNISTRRLVLETAVKKLSPGAQKPGIVVSMILLAPALQMSKTLRARMWEKMCGGRNHNKALDADKNLKNEHMGKVSGAKNRNAGSAFRG